MWHYRRCVLKVHIAEKKQKGPHVGQPEHKGISSSYCWLPGPLLCWMWKKRSLLLRGVWKEMR